MNSLFQIARVIRPAGSFGMLMFGWQPFAVSLERTFDDEGNAQRVVVPDGISTCRKSHYNKGGYDTYEIIVPGHDRVLFHIGNKEIDSIACILVGLDFFDFDPKPGIQDPGIAGSRDGFREFMELADGIAEFPLFVTTVKES